MVSELMLLIPVIIDLAQAMVLEIVLHRITDYGCWTAKLLLAQY